MSNLTTTQSQRKPETTLDRPQANPKQTWYAYASQRLDQFEAQQKLKREAREQVTKRFCLKDTDPVTGVTRVYRLSLELTGTENRLRLMRGTTMLASTKSQLPITSNPLSLARSKPVQITLKERIRLLQKSYRIVSDKAEITGYYLYCQMTPPTQEILDRHLEAINELQSLTSFLVTAHKQLRSQAGLGGKC